MPSNQRLENLTNYRGVLPYASELFGVYQPMLGWRSKRMLDRIRESAKADRSQLIDHMTKSFVGNVKLSFLEEGRSLESRIEIGEPTSARLRGINSSALLQALSQQLRALRKRLHKDDWQQIVNQDNLQRLLSDSIQNTFTQQYQQAVQLRLNQHSNTFDDLQATIRAGMERESAVAATLLALVKNGHFTVLDDLFYADVPDVKRVLEQLERFDDPLNSFDPTKDLANVSVSPIGIVHLFRQFFFELDSFVGTPVGHVWLSPGSTVELIEVSTRRSLIEKTFETSVETTRKTESSTTEQDELSEGIKQDNRDDMKLGFSTTVNQSWPSGSATATGSLNLDKTQQTARENTHKRMRQQSDKVSTEIRQSFKSTFRSVTETTDTSSKRYVLANTTGDLVNYEMRRKMRQVGVQVQDVGTYLCWQTFVDEPGKGLALPQLIHIAKPADLIVVPNPAEIPMPPLTLSHTFSGNAVWNFPDDDPPQRGEPQADGTKFVALNTLDIPGIPNDYEVAFDPAHRFIGIEKSVLAAKDKNSWGANNWWMRGRLEPDGRRITIGIGIAAGQDGLGWDDRIEFKVSGSVTIRLKGAKAAEINKANEDLRKGGKAASDENSQREKKAYFDSVNERVTLASKITTRKFESLREEERTVVYRRLISDLMTKDLYQNLPESETGLEMRHVMSELLNTIFDIDKMLYFVAPEWWKPRSRSLLKLGGVPVAQSMDGNIVQWANDSDYGKYFITEKSEPAPLGSSLGWLLQLDGDDLRNAFLNSPWVKAVIPIRPGKETAAMNWLQSVRVEGSDGLDAQYIAPPAELTALRAQLLTHNPNDPVQDHASPTISDALRALCLTVAQKHEASLSTGKYPTDEINDDNKVSATPIEKVYEHGFNPLTGGFRAATSEPFEVFDQWVEVLPTDQVVPVPVKYDPITGRQMSAGR
jgi:hypothetical protein